MMLLLWPLPRKALLGQLWNLIFNRVVTAFGLTISVPKTKLLAAGSGR